MYSFEKQLKEICEENNLPFDVIERNLWKLSDIYDKSCYLEDIKIALGDYDIENIPDKLLESILETYKERLSDYGSENGWNYILDDVINDYSDDLSEYKTENIYKNMPDYEDTIDYVPHNDGARV